MFGLFKKKYTLLTGEMIKPVDKPISVADASVIFRQHMLKIGFIKEVDAVFETKDFAHQMREHERNLKEELTDAKRFAADQAKGLNAKSKELQTRLSKAVEQEDRVEIEQEILDISSRLEDEASEVREAESNLEGFKLDKRTFLVEYINSRLRGEA